MTEAILYEADGPVAVITLNRPERLNAMDAAMLDALMQAVTQAEEDDAIGAVVVTGAGRGFSSGLTSRPRRVRRHRVGRRGALYWKRTLRRACGSGIWINPP